MSTFAQVHKPDPSQGKFHVTFRHVSKAEAEAHNAAMRAYYKKLYREHPELKSLRTHVRIHQGPLAKGRNNNPPRH